MGKCGGSAEPTFDKIILISIDTLRADYLGAYGAPVGLTPATDELAESSMVFEDAITSAASTLPSHTSLFYSQHTFVHNAYTGNSPDPQLISPVESGEQFRVGTTRQLFDGNYVRDEFSGAAVYDVSTDGQRFLMTVANDSAQVASLVLVQRYCQVKRIGLTDPQHAWFTTGLEPIILGVGQPSCR